MNKQIKCPVCGKEDIIDYHKEEVVCPCCGSDLSIYKLLIDYKNQFKPVIIDNKKWKIITIFLFVVVIGAVVLHFELDDGCDANTIVLLNDSIKEFEKQLSIANQEIETLKKQLPINNSFVYIVQKNDSPCLISKKLYGTERRYKEIEAIITKPLQPGDTLYIK